MPKEIRARDLVRALAKLDPPITLDTKGRGKHAMFRREGFRCYPVPMPNGDKTKIRKHYIGGLCRNFEIEQTQLLELLQSG